jgi:TatD DNase family protein
MIDTHAHIYDEKFTSDLLEVLVQSKANGISKILMPNCDSSTIKGMLAIEQAYPNECFAMMGVHPCYVTDMYAYELAKVEEWWQQRSFVAVGEIGLDYHWDLTYVEEQKVVFTKQIEMALQYKKPIVVHSRESTQDCINIVRPYVAKGLTGVFHCYSGTLDEAHQLVELGFYFGIGGVITYKKSGLAEIVSQLPRELIVLETDAPYLAPVPYRGRRNEPGFTLHVARYLADVWQCTPEKVELITDANAHKLFSL